MSGTEASGHVLRRYYPDLGDPGWPVAQVSGSTPVANRHWPALDGIRGYGVVIIFCFHATTKPRGGWLSVDFFFALSGFLITSLLLGEWDQRRRISFKSFYARRALRLLPLLGLVILATVLAVTLVPRLAGLRHSTLVALPFVLLYSVNWLRASSTNGANAGLFIQTWSLALEEQFYLVWPCLFVLVVRRWSSRARVAGVLVALSVAEMAYRQILIQGGAGSDRIYNATDTHSDGLILGAALAFFLASEEVRTRRLVRWFEEHLLGPAGVVAVGVIALLVAGSSYFNLRVMGVSIAVTNIAIVVLIYNLVLARTRLLVLFLGCRPAIWLGKRSYGLYLWQWPIIYGSDFFLGPLTSHRIERDVIRTVLTFGLAALSYRFYEKRFLARKRRFQMAGPQVVAVGVPTVGGTTAGGVSAPG